MNRIYGMLLFSGLGIQTAHADCREQYQAFVGDKRNVSSGVAPNIPILSSSAVGTLILAPLMTSQKTRQERFEQSMRKNPMCAQVTESI